MRIGAYLVLANLVAMDAGHAQTLPELAVAPAAGAAIHLTWAELQVLPSGTVTLAGEHGSALHLAGPTLWSVLDRAGALDANFHHRVGQVVLATGSDGYTAAVALGEIDPDFENKPVLLAIDPDRHSLRIAIPGDKRLGRDVRDVVSLAVREMGR